MDVSEGARRGRWRYTAINDYLHVNPRNRERRSMIRDETLAQQYGGVVRARLTRTHCPTKQCPPPTSSLLQLWPWHRYSLGTYISCIRGRCGHHHIRFFQSTVPTSLRHEVPKHRDTSCPHFICFRIPPPSELPEVSFACGIVPGRGPLRSPPV